MDDVETLQQGGQDFFEMGMGEETQVSGVRHGLGRGAANDPLPGTGETGPRTRGEAKRAREVGPGEGGRERQVLLGPYQEFQYLERTVYTRDTRARLGGYPRAVRCSEW